MEQRELYFVKKTEFLVPDQWPRVQAELTSIVEVAMYPDQDAAELACEESITDEYAAGRGQGVRRGGSPTSYRLSDPKAQLTRYFTFVAL